MNKILLIVCFFGVPGHSIAQDYLPLSGGTLSGDLALNITDQSVSSVNKKSVLFQEFGTTYGSISMPRDGYGNLLFNVATGQRIKWSINDVQKMFLNENGNLSLAGTLTGTSAMFSNNSSSTQTLSLVNTHASGYSGIEYLKKDGITVGAYIGLNSDDSYVRINSVDKPIALLGGNFGIGTTSPTNFGSGYRTSTIQGTAGSISEVKSLNVTARLAADEGEGAGIINVATSHPLALWTNSIERMRITAEGKVGIGTATPSEKFSVNGTMRAKEIKVEAANWPDYVFGPTYTLPDLKATEQFIKANKHLPEIPSASEVEQKGISLGEMNSKLLKKIEELTLYIIELKRGYELQQGEINQLKSLHK